MVLTHKEMVQEALGDDQASCKYDDDMTYQDIQAYILVNFNEQVTVNEISNVLSSVSDVTPV